MRSQFIAYSVMALAFVATPHGSASASDWDDCFEESDLRLVVEACTSIIDSEQLPAWQRAMATNNRASALFQRGELEQAESEYTRALVLDPTYTKAFYNRGTLRFARKMFAEAIEDFSHAIRLDDENYAVYHNRGVAYEKNGKYDEAIADFTKTIALRPGLYAAHNNRGNVLRKKGRLREALEDFDAAIAINGDIPQLTIIEQRHT